MNYISPGPKHITYPLIEKRKSKTKAFEILKLGESRHCLADSFTSTDHFEIIWIKRGTGNLHVDMDQYEIKDDSIFFIVPGQICRFSFPYAPTGYKIAFAPGFFFLGNQTSSHPVNDLQSLKGCYEIGADNGLPEAMEQLVRSLEKECSEDLQLKSEVLTSLLTVFILYLTRTRKISGSTLGRNRESEINQHFFSLLEKKFMHMKAVSDYASLMAISSNHLSEVIRRVTGFPPSYHINQRIIIEAKRMAMCSNLKMKEIASVLGFADFPHFSKFFKAASGVSFTEFKKDMQAV